MNPVKTKTGPHRHQNKILIVEDDPSLVEVLENLFEFSDYNYQIYHDVEDIVELVLQYQPDVILLDYLLPSTNGGNLCQQIKENNATSRIPVIIYSAIAKQLLPIKEYNCNFFIEKPFDLDFLLLKIRQCCNKDDRK